MYENISEACKNAIAKSSRKFIARLVDGENVYENIKSIKSIKLDTGSSSDGVISIGSTVSSSIEIILDTEASLSGRKVELQIGVILEDDTVEYIPMRKFKLSTPTKSDNLVTVDGGGPLSMEAETIYFSELDYPTDTVAMLNEISTMIGVDIETDGLEPITIDEKPVGYTCREIIGYIAAKYGKFAVETRTGSIALKWYEAVSDNILAEKIDTPQLEEQIYIVDRLVCSVSTEDNLVIGDGSLGISISNPLMTSEDMERAWEIIEGYTYKPGTINMRSGNPCIDPWDALTYGAYTIICAVLNLQYDGGVQIEISSKGQTSIETNYKGPTIRALERTYAEILIINQAMVNKLTVDEADARYISVDKLDVIALEVEEAVVKNLSADFADVHLANIDIADIGTFFADSGLLKEVTIVDGHITGELDAVRINADVITSGTLAVDRLLVTGENSIVYQINVDSSGLSAEELEDETYQKYLNGTDIVANSITAKQIAAGTITANEIDVFNLFAQDIVATGSITGATLIGTYIEANSGSIGKLTIDEYGVLTTELSGNFTENYINIAYAFKDYGMEDSEGNICYVRINGETGLNTRGVSFTRIYDYDYENYPQVPFSINTIGVKKYTVDTDIQSDGITVNKVYYGYNDEYSTTELSQIGEDNNGIYFETETEMNKKYSICRIDFDRVDTNWILANTIQTAAGADLDTINNNLDGLLDRFYVVTGTLPNASNTNFVFEIPSNLNNFNSVCIGLIYYNSNGTWYQMYESQAICLYPGRLSYTASDATNSRPFKIILYRYA